MKTLITVASRVASLTPSGDALLSLEEVPEQSAGGRLASVTALS